MAAGFLDINSLSGVYFSAPDDSGAAPLTEWALHRRWYRNSFAYHVFALVGLALTNLYKQVNI